MDLQINHRRENDTWRTEAYNEEESLDMIEALVQGDRKCGFL